MAKTFLFSPIGGNDPVSSANESDGSMLHICRHYQPDVVYLYLSAEMVERSRADDRYRYCIRKLGEKQGHDYEIHLIERDALEAVHEYDFYYKEFHEIIGEIENVMEPEDRLLVNIASGTPAMKSELLIAAVLSEFHSIPIQVITPTRKINMHKGEDLDYDPEYYWELDKDNDESAENRCIEVKCPNLVATIKKNIIIRHLCSYDYAAAFQLAKEIETEIPEISIRMIEGAMARLQLNLPLETKLENRYGFRLRKKLSSAEDQIFEYALSLQIKLKHRDYGDFIRAISPLLTDLFMQILQQECGIDIRNYCNKRRNNIEYLSVSKLMADHTGIKIKEILDKEFGTFTDKPLAASNLRPILVELMKDKTAVQDVERIRLIEEKLRNLLAHEIVAINEEKLQKLLGEPITMQQILAIIKRLVEKAGIKITKEDWNSYDTMNQCIIDAIEL